MDKQEKESILQNYYHKTKRPSAFAGPQKLYRILKKKISRSIYIIFYQEVVRNEDSYSLSKEPRQNFKTAKVFVSSIDEQFDADSTSEGNLKKYTDGVRFLLFVIDIFLN